MKNTKVLLCMILILTVLFVWTATAVRQVEYIGIIGLHLPVVGTDAEAAANELYVRDAVEDYTLESARWISKTTGETYTGRFRADEEVQLEVQLKTDDLFSPNATVAFASIEEATAERELFFGDDYNYERHWLPGMQTLIVRTIFFTPLSKTVLQVQLPTLPIAAVGQTPDFVQAGSYDSSGEYWHINYGRNDLGAGWYGAEKWTDETTGAVLDQQDRFIVGHTYRYSVAITANEGAVFQTQPNGLNPNVRVRTADGTEAAVSPFINTLDELGLHDIIASFTMTAVGEVSEVSVTGLAAPQAEVAPSYDPVTDSEAYQVYPYTSGNWKNGVLWKDLTTGTEMIPGTDRFAAGHRYRCQVLLQIRHSAYRFASENGAPKVSCILNGKTATQWNAYAESCETKIGLYYDFPQLPSGPVQPEEIGQVEVTGLDEPEPGEKPDYAVSVPQGADYSVDTSYETEKRKSGVLWYDATEQRYLTPDEPFTAGHSYRVYVSLVTDRGYVFSTSNDGRFNVAATLNGKSVDVEDTGDEEALEVTRSFACAGQIDSVSIALTEPEEGAEPDWNMTVAQSGAPYEIEPLTSGSYINGIYWRDVTDDNRTMQFGDRFAAGHTYTVTVSVVAKAGYVFGDYHNYGLTAYLGGLHPDEIIDWGEPERNIGLVRTFTLPDAAAVRLPGDADADGKVDMLDALRVVQYQEMVVPINMANADVNGDGKVTVEDARLIGQWAAGWNVGMK